MKGFMMGLLAETPIHAGSGRGDGVIDLPVAREGATDYPVLVGSSLKGAMRDHFVSSHRASGVAKPEQDEKVNTWFGSTNQAGEMVVTEGRLLLLPVRSLTGSVRWATCPHLLERLSRDLARVGLPAPSALPSVKKGEVLGCQVAKLFLEERLFEASGEVPKEWIDTVAPLILHPFSRDRLTETMVVLNDDDFTWFARYGLMVQARNQLESGSKQSKNLWYEETLPPDTLMYTTLFQRYGNAEGVTKVLFPDGQPYLQVGGNETVGQGWFAVTPYRSEGGAV